MILLINDKWRIATDEHQWIVQQRIGKSGKEQWKARSWHTTPLNAVWSVVSRGVREIPGSYPAADSIEVLGQHLTALGDDIRAALDRGTDG